MRRLKSVPFVMGFALGVGFFIVLNMILVGSAHELSSGGICFDCGLPAGFPFTLYHTETFVGGGGFVGSGVFANAVIALGAGVALGFVFDLAWSVLRATMKSNKFR